MVQLWKNQEILQFKFDNASLPPSPIHGVWHLLCIVEKPFENLKLFFLGFPKWSYKADIIIDDIGELKLAKRKEFSIKKYRLPCSAIILLKRLQQWTSLWSKWTIPDPFQFKCSSPFFFFFLLLVQIFFFLLLLF